MMGKRKQKPSGLELILRTEYLNIFQLQQTYFETLNERKNLSGKLLIFSVIFLYLKPFVSRLGQRCFFFTFSSAIQ
jgi:hypothetical protein